MAHRVIVGLLGAGLLLGGLALTTGTPVGATVRACSFERLPSAYGGRGTLSPDGNRVLYEGSEGYVVEDLDDGSSHPLEADDVYLPLFDDTGDLLVFASDDDLDPDAEHPEHVQQLFVHDVEAGTSRQLSAYASSVTLRIRAFDGSHLVLWGPAPDGSDPYGSGAELWRIDVQSGDATVLADLPADATFVETNDDGSVRTWFEVAPTVEPDTASAASADGAHGDAPTTLHVQWDLVLQEAGDEPRVLAHQDDFRTSSHSFFYGGPNVTVDQDGSHLLLLSPVAPLGEAEGSNQELWRYDLASEQWTALADGLRGSFPTGGVATTTDGRHVAFTGLSNPTGDNPDGGRELFVTGQPSVVRQLTAAAGNQDVSHWAMSDDGTRLLVRSDAALDEASPTPPPSGSFFVATCPLYDDVSLGHPFFAAVTWADANGVTTGYADGGFHPAAPVSRAAFVAFLHRLAGSPEPSGAPTFHDVSPSHPFAVPIAWAQESGTIRGYSDGTFRPQRSISRGALTTILHHDAGDPAPTGDSPFSDVSLTHPQHAAITWAAEQGYVEGYDDGSYRSGNPVTRQATVAILQRWAADQP